MPAVVLYLVFIVAAVVMTGAALDELKVRRSRRVLVWSGLSLPGLPFSFVAFYLSVWIVCGGKYWFY